MYNKDSARKQLNSDHQKGSKYLKCLREKGAKVGPSLLLLDQDQIARTLTCCLNVCVQVKWHLCFATGQTSALAENQKTTRTELKLDQAAHASHY